MIPVETKAIAIIMLALKLMYALDDKTEYDIDKVCKGILTVKPGFLVFCWTWEQFHFRGMALSSWITKLCKARHGYRECSEFKVRIIWRLSLITIFSIITKNPIQPEEIVYSVDIPGQIRRPVFNQSLLPYRSYYGDKTKVFYDCFPTDHPNQTERNTDLAKYCKS